MIVNYGQALLVEDDSGNRYQCVARKTVGRIVCGDRVWWQRQDHGPAVITGLQPRASLLSRPDQRGKAKPLCANIDQLIIVGSVQRDDAAGDRPITIKRNLIDSYIVAAELLDIEPTLVINKIDLTDDLARSWLIEDTAPYRTTGYRVLYTSVVTGHDLEKLRAQLHGRSSILVGESGVGKSSLVKALLPDHEVRIGEMSAAAGKGRHTTTVTALFHLPEGGHLIDSPGVREFRLWKVSPGELAAGFREFREFLGACRYRDCRHSGEPDCAITAAADRNLISPVRLSSYHELLRVLADNPQSP